MTCHADAIIGIYSCCFMLRDFDKLRDVGSSVFTSEKIENSVLHPAFPDQDVVLGHQGLYSTW